MRWKSQVEGGEKDTMGSYGAYLLTLTRSWSLALMSTIVDMHCTQGMRLSLCVQTELFGSLHLSHTAGLYTSFFP
jgi:hypothetical protein